MNGFLCDGDWDSEINGNDDGFFDLRVNQTTGDITGTHIYPNGDAPSVWGTCTHPTPQNPVHFIDLLEPHGTFSYRFSGVVVPDATGAGKHRVPNGKRRVVRPVPRNIKTALADDDWVAEKTT